MITRVRMSGSEKLESKMASWAREIDAARYENRWSSELASKEAELERYFESEPEWDQEELAELAARSA
jgi:hypothetical protein